MRFLTLVLALLLCGTAYAQVPSAPDAAAPIDVIAPVDVAEAASADAPAAEAPTAVAAAVAPTADVTLAVAVSPADAATTTVPTTDADAGVVVGQMMDAAKNGHWTVSGGLLLLLLMWLFNRMGLAAKVGSKAVPWITLATGAVLATAVGLIHGVAVLDAVKLGVMEGLVAVGLWEAVFKHIKFKPPAA